MLAICSLVAIPTDLLATELHDLVAAARSQFQPVTDEHVQLALQQVRDALQSAENAPYPIGQDWQTYLLWNEQREHAKGGSPVDVEFWQRVFALLAENHAGLERKQFGQLRGAIRHLLDVVDARAQLDLQAEYSALLDKLAQALPADESTPSSATLGRLSDLLTQLARRQQAAELVTAVRKKFVHPNLIVAIPQSAIKQVLDQQVEQPYDYKRNIGGAATTGRGVIKATIEAALVADDATAAIRVRIAGESLASTTSYEDSVRVSTRGNLQFTSTATVRPTSSGLQADAVRTEGELSSRVVGVSSPYRGRRASQARAQARARHDARLSLAESLAIKDLNGHLTKELNAGRDDVNALFRERVHDPLARFDRFPEEITFRNDKASTWLFATVADQRQLAAPPDVLDCGPEDSVRLCCHESVINNTAAAVLASRTRSFDELFGQLTGQALTTATDDPPLTMTFSNRGPLGVHFLEGEVLLTLSPSRYDYQGHTHSGMEIQLRLKVEQSETNWCLTRVGKPNITPYELPDGSRARLNVRELAFRRILLNRLERDWPASVDLSLINLPTDLKLNARLATESVQIRDGWFLLSAKVSANGKKALAPASETPPVSH